jgi:hypothetical protein
MEFKSFIILKIYTGAINQQEFMGLGLPKKKCRERKKSTSL